MFSSSSPSAGGLPALSYGLVVPVASSARSITALPQLLCALELAACSVTVDAKGCWKTIAKGIREADADYILVLKSNQETVHAEVKSHLDDAIAQQTASPHWKAREPSALKLAYTETERPPTIRVRMRLQPL